MINSHSQGERETESEQERKKEKNSFFINDLGGRQASAGGHRGLEETGFSCETRKAG